MDKRNKIILLLTVILLILIIASFKIFNIEPERVDCFGVFQQKCLVANGHFLYEGIINFDYEEGYEYKLLILRYPKIFPMQDESSIKYVRLITLSKQEI